VPTPFIIFQTQLQERTGKPAESNEQVAINKAIITALYKMFLKLVSKFHFFGKNALMCSI